MQAKDFLREKGLEDTSDAFKEGVECALQQFKDNVFRLSLLEIVKDFKDRLERSKRNLEYAPSRDAREFQIGYQAVCFHFLGM